MGARISRHVRGNAVGYVALFFALSGGAYALQGKNTVDSGDIKKGQVKTSDVANDSGKGALKGSDIAANALTGKDLDEASLAQVPNAKSADSAQTAQSAQNAETLDGQDSSAFLGADAKAADAGLLDGQDSSDFVPASMVKTLPRTTLDDTVPGDAAAGGNAILTFTPEFAVVFNCWQNISPTSDEQVRASIYSPAGDPISVSGVAATHGGGGLVQNVSHPAGPVFVDLTDDVNNLKSTHFIAILADGRIATGTLSAEVNDAQAPGSDCTVGGRVIGP
jgi:hypothetical protein